MSSTIRIVVRPNAVGIARDVRILESALDARWGPTVVSPYRSIHPLRALFGHHDTTETIVFLGRIRGRWLRSGARYVLIPNPERFPKRQLALLSRIDHVLCKTRSTAEVFEKHHHSVHHVGFTSVDRRLPDVAPDYGRFLHLAGGSSLKGTEDLLNVWSRHPEWPTLTVVSHRRRTTPDRVFANVDWIDRYLPDDELRQLQNRCGIHLCPSRSEGWGHYIVEAMSCGAVTLTTDAPPMNELVAQDRGVLVPVARSEPRKLGTDYFVDPEALEAAIEGLIRSSPNELAVLGRRAREWYTANDRGFSARLDQVWAELSGTRAPPGQPSSPDAAPS